MPWNHADEIATGETPLLPDIRCHDEYDAVDTPPDPDRVDGLYTPWIAPEKLGPEADA